jgi:hypothetical protein
MTTTTKARPARTGRALLGMLATLGLALAGLTAQPADEAAAGVRFSDILVSGLATDGADQTAVSEAPPVQSAVQKVRE